MNHAILQSIADAVPWLVAVAGLLLAALANGVETGLYRLNRIRLRLRIESGDRRASILQRMVEDLRGMIIVCLVGTNASEFIVTAVVTGLVASAGWVESDLGVELLTTAILTPILFVFGTVIPKSLFTAEADHWLYGLARPLSASHWMVRKSGLVAALNGISNTIVRLMRCSETEATTDPFQPRQRLRAILSEGAAEGVISGYQHELASKVLEMRERPVRDVMIPMARVAAVAADIRRETFIEELRRHSFSRLPVWEGRRDNVVGIVHINDVLAAGGEGFDLAALMRRDFLKIPADTTVSQALLKLRKTRSAMAVVLDEKERAIGILTVKDLVEEIVGELSAW